MATGKSDAELADLRKSELLRRFRKATCMRGAVAVVFVGIGIILLIVGNYPFAIACLIAAVTFVVLTMDARGHIREVQNRGERFVLPNLAAAFGDEKTTTVEGSDLPKKSL